MALRKTPLTDKIAFCIGSAVSNYAYNKSPVSETGAAMFGLFAMVAFKGLADIATKVVKENMLEH